MKATELRSGNWVSIPSAGINARVELFGNHYLAIDTTDVDLDQKDKSFSLDEINGVELNRQWLVNFGFKIENDWAYKYLSEEDGLSISCNIDYNLVYSGVDPLPHIQYVHQIQNLYFALTGEELEVKGG